MSSPIDNIGLEAAPLQAVITAYPDHAKARLTKLRELILTVAKEHQLGTVTENIKWGQASFSVPAGTPVRIDWTPGSPNHISLFVNCNTKLIDTFRELFATELALFGNREIRLPLKEDLPETELKQCLLLAFRYHKIKHLPMLGT